MDKNQKSRGFRSWKTRDILTTVVLALAIGILNLVAYQAFGVLMTINPVVATLLLGVIYLPFLFVMHVVRRGGAGLLAGVVVGLVGIPFTPTGFGNLIAQIINGLFAELPYMVTRYRRFDTLLSIIAGVVSCGIATGLFYAPPVNLGSLGVGTQLLAWTGGLASGVAAGVLVPFLAKLIAQTGVLSSITGPEETDTVLDV